MLLCEHGSAPVFLGQAFDEAHGTPARPKNDNAWLLQALRCSVAHVLCDARCRHNIVALGLSPVPLQSKYAFSTCINIIS